MEAGWFWQNYVVAQRQATAIVQTLPVQVTALFAFLIFIVNSRMTTFVFHISQQNLRKWLRWPGGFLCCQAKRMAAWTLKLLLPLLQNHIDKCNEWKKREPEKEYGMALKRGVVFNEF